MLQATDVVVGVRDARVLRNALERRIGDLENGDKRIITRQQMLYEAIESLEASFTEKFKAVFAFTTV